MNIDATKVIPPGTIANRWKDVPDYIIGVTKEIWEDRGVHTLHDYYGEKIIVRSPASVVVGNDDVIDATMATLAEFPDRQLLGEDVIWCGAPEDGVFSSHRLISLATHSGDGVYGPASGTRLRYRILADCYARGTRIEDEWLVRDQGAIVRQMGMTPKQYAADLIAREGGPDTCVKPLTPDTDVSGPYAGRGNESEVGSRLEDILTRIMGADMAVIRRAYDRAVQTEYPGAVTGHGHADADRFWMSLRAAFPKARFQVEHVVGRDDANMPPRASVRWSLWGRHSGWGAFGAPSGAMVYVLGLTHAEFGPWGLRREWTLYDETAIWKQIHLASP
ncbi:ester cyclase [Jannaschia sp. LMIT008]|uniref:ester cyclase n=1 Tax=Jannaschia maritima TaxID=3032585 RepID=UPI0028114278|nr:ester cyclase [Jannaschia sp. LMIT008]